MGHIRCADSDGRVMDLEGTRNSRGGEDNDGREAGEELRAEHDVCGLKSALVELKSTEGFDAVEDCKSSEVFALPFCPPLLYARGGGSVKF